MNLPRPIHFWYQISEEGTGLLTIINESHPHHGSRVWVLDGKRHRLDGPAIEYNNGKEDYYVEDIKYQSHEDYEKAVELYLAREIKDKVI
jgi:hypothetical protein